MAIATTSRREQIQGTAQGSATLRRYQHTAGALLASAGAIALMAIITAEALSIQLPTTPTRARSAIWERRFPRIA